MLLVKLRSAVALSDPIALPGEGLSVVLPVGPGWKTLNEWTYEQDNRFALIAVYSLQGALPIEVRWQYCLAEMPASPESLLQQIAARFTGAVTPIKKFEGPLPFYQIHMFSRTDGEQMLLAAAVPQEGRALLLQLKSYSDSSYLPELFEQLAAHVQFHPDPRRQAGSRLFEELSQQFYPRWLEALSRQSELFVLTSPAGRMLGYSKTAVSSSSGRLQAAIEQEQIFRQTDSPRVLSRFESTNDLTEFTWTTVRQVRRRPIQTQLRRQSDGSLQIEDTFQRQEIIWPVKNAVPEFLLPLAARAMLEFEETQAALDIIASSGQVVPVLISRSDAQGSSEIPEQTKFAVKIDFLHHSENYEEYYFDAEQNLLAWFEALPGQPSRLWKTASEADIRRLQNPGRQQPDSIVQLLNSSELFCSDENRCFIKEQNYADLFR